MGATEKAAAGAAQGPSLASLLGRFPALELLGADRLIRRIPVVRQMGSAECGAACLSMVLGYHGKRVRLEEVRELTGVGRDGTNALALVSAARRYGMVARGIRVEIDDLAYLAPATVLHWGMNHFVVLDRVKGGVMELVDPAVGRRRVPLAEVRRSFTGIAILIEPRGDLRESDAGSSATVRYLKLMAADPGRSRVLWTTLMLQVFGLAIPAATGALVDRVVPRGDIHLFTVLCVGVAGIIAFHFLASLIRAHLLLHLRTRLDVTMTMSFLAHLLELPYAFFQHRTTGDLMMRLNSNTTIRELLTSGTLSAVVDGGFAGLSLFVLWVLDPAMGAIVVGLCALQCAALLMSKSPQRELLSQELEKQAKAQSYQVEMLSGIQTLKAMGCEGHAEERWSHLYVDVLNASLARGRISALVEAFSGTLRLAAPLIILSHGARAVLHGGLSLGLMLSLSALATGVLGPVAGLMNIAMQLQILGSYVERQMDVLDASPEQAADLPQAGPLRGRVELDGVSFRYSAMSPWVVQDVSVTIEPGSFVAIVGRSGSGKSTLASLLLGLHQPTAGRVLYDGLGLDKIDRRSVRRQLGIVTQDPQLFAGSIRSNISLTNPGGSLEDVRRAARIAAVDEEIGAMPMGYDTPLGDGGSAISGGQRQRIALARAVTGNPAVLLLDEATSALDAVTEARVKHNLASLGCTRIVVAHRLSSIAEADLILVMQDGRLVERGTHRELMAKHGVFAELVAAQQG